MPTRPTVSARGLKRSKAVDAQSQLLSRTCSPGQCYDLPQAAFSGLLALGAYRGLATIRPPRACLAQSDLGSAPRTDRKRRRLEVSYGASDSTPWPRTALFKYRTGPMDLHREQLELLVPSHARDLEIFPRAGTLEDRPFRTVTVSLLTDATGVRRRAGRRIMHLLRMRGALPSPKAPESQPKQLLRRMWAKSLL